MEIHIQQMADDKITGRITLPKTEMANFLSESLAIIEKLPNDRTEDFF